jgi:hypothetical protein
LATSTSPVGLQVAVAVDVGVDILTKTTFFAEEDE